MVRGAVPAPFFAAVEFGEGADADLFAEVDVARDGGCGEYRALARSSSGASDRALARKRAIERRRAREEHS